MTSSTIDRQVERRLRDIEVRYTRGRREVVGALVRTEGPRSAAELSEEMGNAVPLSSLYRTLSTLEEAGVLAPHYSSPGVTRYELAEWIRGHHHHLVCLDCGQVEDIEAPADLERQLEEIVRGVAGSAAFAENNHALEIEGLCARCK